MARRTYNDIDAEVLLRLANRQDITPAQRSFFIKDAYLNVAMLFKHKEIQKVVTNEFITQGNDSFAPVNQDVWYPTAMRNITDGYLIRLDSQDRVERAVVKPTTSPYTYYWYGGVFYFEAFANAQKSIKLWYKRKPTDFSGNTSSELDELFDPFIIMEAARIGYETVRDFAEAETQKKMFMADAFNKKIPVEGAKLNDYRQGFKVRMK